MPPQIPTNYHRWDPNIFARDLQVADSLRVVVDAMRLQSGKKDEKPEKARKNMCFGTSMLWTMGWNGIWDIQKYPKMGFGPKKSRNPMVDLAGWWMCFQLYPQPIETTHLFAINDPCMESWAFLFVVTDSYWIVVDTLHILFFLIPLFANILPVGRKNGASGLYQLYHGYCAVTWSESTDSFSNYLVGDLATKNDDSTLTK